jgi:hypothetical protein
MKARRGELPRWSRVLSVCTIAFVACVLGRNAVAQGVTTRPIVTLYPGQSLGGEPVVARGEGKDVAVWRWGGELQYSWSSEGGATWAPGVSFQNGLKGTTYSLAPWNADSFFVAVAMVSTIGVSLGEFSSGELLWRTPLPTVPPVSPGTGHPEPYHSPQLIADRQRGILYLVYSHQTPVTFGLASARVHITRSLDRGQTWSEPKPLSDHFSNGGRAALGPSGEIYVVWHERQRHRMLGRCSLDRGKSFGDTFFVANVRYNPSKPPGYSAPSGRINPVPWEGSMADFPAVGVDVSGGPERGTLYVAWAERAAGQPTPGSGRTVVAEEPNHNWCETAGVATEAEVGDDVEGDHGPIENPDYPRDEGEVIAFTATGGTTLWIEGELTNNPGGCYVMELWCGDETPGPMRVGVVQLCPAPGQSWPLVYTVPNTGRYFLKGDGSPRRYYAYRMRLRTMAVEEGEGALDHRDIVVVRSRDGGATWTAPRRVSEGMGRLDDALPNLAVDGAGRVHVAWYGRVDDGACGTRVQTYWAWTPDAGETFAPARALDPDAALWSSASGVGLPCAYLSGGREMGDRAGVSVEGSDVLVAWVRQHPEVPAVMSAAVVPEPVTAVAVGGFAGRVEGERVRLTWQVRSAEGIARFRVMREEPGGGYAPVAGGEVAAERTGQYEVWDEAVRAAERHRYRLEGEMAGSWRTLEEVEVVIGARSGRLELRRASPNPFRERVEVEVTVPEAGECEVGVYDVAGKRVAWVHHGALAAGVHGMGWDGRDGNGRSVAPGIYTIRATLGADSRSLRVIRVR